MDADIFRRMDSAGRNYWWYRGKEAFVRQIAGRAGIEPGGMVLDLGCGTGTLFEFLEGWGSVTGLELSADAIILARSRSDVPVVRARTEAIPFRSAHFSLIAIFDCLEHLSDDRAALEQVRHVLKPDGHVIISVPAYHFLRSWRDDQLAHMRRYSPAHLKAVVRDSGFRIKAMTFGYFCLFLPLVFKALKDRHSRRPHTMKSDIADLSEPWNSLIAGWLKVEAWVAARTGLPIGTSLFCLVAPQQKNPG